MAELSALAVLGLVAFGGGAFGAAIGGLRALGLAGLVVAAGEAIEISQTGFRAGAGDLVGLGSTGVTAHIGLGPWLGPHVAFGGAVAAAAYAARQGPDPTGFAFHEAKQISRALGPRPDVLLVGGLFGVVGLLIAHLSVGLALPWDPLAGSIVLSGFLHRLTFGYPAIGSLRRNPLDMSPYERGQRRRPVSEEGATLAPDERRFVVEPWLPGRYGWTDATALGLVVGIVAAFATHQTGSPLLAFGVSAATLLFLDLDRPSDPLPATHHVAWVAGVAVVAVGVDASSPVWIAIVVGAGFGIVTGLVGEVAQRLFYAHGDTHLDPPAVAIVVGTFLVALLDIFGVVTQAIIPTPV